MTILKTFDGTQIKTFQSSPDADRSPMRTIGKSGSAEGVILAGNKFARVVFKVRTKIKNEVVPFALDPASQSTIPSIGVVYYGDNFGFLSYMKDKQIFISRDNGATFSYALSISNYAPLQSVEMSDGGIACCVGGYLRYTYDKGLTFGGSSSVTMNPSLNWCEKFGTVVGTGSYMLPVYSDDFCRSVKSASCTALFSNGFHDTAFVTTAGTVLAMHDPNIDYVITPQGVYLARSTDGGKTYSNVTVAADRNSNGRIVQLPNGRIVVFTYKTNDPRSYYSDDDGATWTQGGVLPVFQNRRYFSAYASRSKNFIVGGISKEGIYCFSSLDGITFTTPSTVPSVPSVVTEEGRGIYMAADDTILIKGRYYSKDYLATVLDNGLTSNYFSQIHEQNGKLVIYNNISSGSLVIVG